MQPGGHLLQTLRWQNQAAWTACETRWMVQMMHRSAHDNTNTLGSRGNTVRMVCLRRVRSLQGTATRTLSTKKRSSSAPAASTASVSILVASPAPDLRSAHSANEHNVIGSGGYAQDAGYCIPSAAPFNSRPNSFLLPVSFTRASSPNRYCSNACSSSAAVAYRTQSVRLPSTTRATPSLNGRGKRANLLALACSLSFGCRHCVRGIHFEEYAIQMVLSNMHCNATARTAKWKGFPRHLPNSQLTAHPSPETL